MTQRKRRRKPEIVASGNFIQLVNDNGWEYADRVNTTGIVAIVALTRDNEIIFVEQYRPAIRKRVIEIPAGLAGDIPGEESEALTKAGFRLRFRRG